MQPDKATLFNWLEGAIDDLPVKAQIVLNFDGNSIAWEVKAVYEVKSTDVDHERTEVRRFGRLKILRLP